MKDLDDLIFEIYGWMDEINGINDLNAFLYSEQNRK